MTMADRIVVLREGVVEQVGSPLELYLRPQNAFVAGFIGSPKMNFLPAVLNAEGVPELGTARSVPIRVMESEISKSVSIGIRPEHLVIAESPEVAVISGQVLSVEHLGSDTFVQLDCGLGEGDGAEVNVRLGGIFEVDRGDQLSLSAKAPDCWHVFDQDGKRTPYSPAG
jgi:ABC-type sugar transport system ATPase subunit